MRRLHNPGGVRLPSKLFNENVVIAREDIGLRYDVHIDVTAELVLLSELGIFPLELLAVTLDVLYH